MPQTIDRTIRGQIVGGTFTNLDNADKAVDAFLDLGVPRTDIQTVSQVSDKPEDDVYKDILTDRGSAESQAKYYDRKIREGKILVVVYNVVDPAPVIDIFDHFGAEYNPNGSRNLRDDVLGMTAGALAGAVAGGAAGTVAAGPLGAAAGAVAGVVIGAGSGAAIGKGSEHRK